MKVYRDGNDKVVNIGEWDYLISLDEEGNQVTNNPMPNGLTESDEEIVVGFDGGLYAQDDDRQFQH